MNTTDTVNNFSCQFNYVSFMISCYHTYNFRCKQFAVMHLFLIRIWLWIFVLYSFNKSKLFSSRICYRSNLQMCSIKKSVLKNVNIFTGKHVCWSLFLMRLQATGKHMCWSLSLMRLQTFRPATLLKRDSSRGAFLWILQKFLRTPILKNLCERLLMLF